MQLAVAEEAVDTDVLALELQVDQVVVQAELLRQHLQIKKIKITVMAIMVHQEIHQELGQAAAVVVPVEQESLELHLQVEMVAKD
jgi:hypothetical protein